ncbi:Pkinase-domain-containing protein [Phellopilus nigrolimitatus]|nr:Pkinase-domain-containing protein [Phellopilus nigrolimitatus]
MNAQPDVHQLFKRLETVGKGAYGSVHRGVELATGNVVALKIINLDTADDDVEDIQREVALLAHLRDAVNITKYYGCYLDGPRVWIVMEYAHGGSVRTLMKACATGHVAERYIVLITRELLLALAYLHKAGVIHRDIKAANVLITATGKVILCDFGVSALLVTQHSKRNTLVGTPYWMAPEVAQPVPAYDTKADIWSLGITIYEMVTGSPPHSNLDGIKVVHLIPRSKPPRLGDGEGSKDLRDFVHSCLRESPVERPPAEELSKTKWIKATAKTHVTVLKELLVQYEAWQQAGGTRASIADPLPWEDEEEEDMRPYPPDDGQESWEFDTVRARSSAVQPESAIDDIYHPATNARVPNSLRMLFPDDGGNSAPSDPFRLQNININRDPWSRSNTPTLTPTPAPLPAPSLATDAPHLPSTSPLPSRTRAPRRDDHSAEETARQANFVFPPRRAVVPSKSKLSTPAPTIDDEEELPPHPPSPDRERTRLFPLGHAQGYARGIDDATMPSAMLHVDPPSAASAADPPNSPPFGGSTIRPSANYREVRTSRGVPDIAIPPANIRDGIGIGIGTAAPPSPSMPRNFFGRKRSQSSAAASTASSNSAGSSARHRNLAFPHDFHFPPIVAATANIAGPSLPLPILSSPTRSRRARARRDTSPSQVSFSSSSESSRSPGAHQTTHSLDNAAAFGIREAPPLMVAAADADADAGGGLDLPPSISRAHSANALSESPAPSPALAVSRRPSVTRQASVAVMEGVHSRAVASASPDKADTVVAPVPGLKDVLKIPSLSSEMRLGIADLLPPSPSSASANRRFFAPAPSSLSSSITPTDTNGSSQPSLSLSTTRAPAVPATDVSASTSSSSATYVSHATRSHSVSSASSIASMLGAGPSLRPLDLGALMVSREATHGELARTVDELVQWLGIVETGLSAVLERTASSTISIMEEDSTSTFPDDEYYLEQMHENDEDTENALDDLDLSPLEDEPIQFDDDRDDDGAPGTFEQFLATMQKSKTNRKDVSESDYSSDESGGANFTPEFTIHPHEQLAADVT